MAWVFYSWDSNRSTGLQGLGVAYLGGTISYSGGISHGYCKIQSHITDSPSSYSHFCSPGTIVDNRIIETPQLARIGACSTGNSYYADKSIYSITVARQIIESPLNYISSCRLWTSILHRAPYYLKWSWSDSLSQ